MVPLHQHPGVGCSLLDLGTPALEASPQGPAPAPVPIPLALDLQRLSLCPSVFRATQAAGRGGDKTGGRGVPVTPTPGCEHSPGRRPPSPGTEGVSPRADATPS